MVTKVRVHGDKQGVWYIARCYDCGNVHKYRMQIAEAGPVRCKHCGIWMDLRGLTGDPAGARDAFGIQPGHAA